MSADAPRRLGRGLEALISTAKQQREAPVSASAAAQAPGTEFRSLAIRDIHPNHFQPRRSFSEVELKELESSLKANGLLQPITVRHRVAGGWELVAGERRFRAASRLGWSDIPAIVRDFDDREMLTLALVENLQRADLNTVEEAEGYQRLIDEFGLTQQQVAEAVGKDRTTITNLLRVLTLPPAVRNMVEAGQISGSHARALLAIKDERKLTDVAHEVVARQLSVRDVEARARSIGEGMAKATAPSRSVPPAVAPSINADPQVRRVEDQLRRRLQTDVSIQTTGADKGAVKISFYSADDLERILEIVLGGGRSDFD